MRYPVLLDGWLRLFQETEQVPEGLAWYVVEATVVSDQPLDHLQFRLDYGRYTLGSKGIGIRAEAGRPYLVDTSSEVTDGPVPKALEIRVKGEWFRFPIDIR
ncbi:MAG TPA: hypothetical protein VK464_10330 [Symbiobacteriaceae bacterium]|jgi:hypothetical protein|nr:hypothetical protein [Symbiobacteriaceae bacterium]